MNDNKTFFRDPYNGGLLIDNNDNTYTSEYSGELFLFDRDKNIFIPLYIDLPEVANESAIVYGDYMIGENTSKKYIIKEDAHVEDNYLVGNITGRKFLIEDNGVVFDDYFKQFYYDFNDGIVRYVPCKKEDIDIDSITDKILEDDMLDSNISLPLGKYLIFVKENIDCIEAIDIELLVKIFLNQDIDESLLIGRLNILKDKKNKHR